MKQKFREVVINKCFGGFGLSYEATMEYAKLRGFKLYAYTDGRDKNGNKLSFDLPNKDRLIEIKSEKEAKEAFIVYYYKDKNFKEHFFDSDIERDDPYLIKVVKKLEEKANDNFAELKIVKIPFDIKYTIDDYDGAESIEEEHKIWN
jgi:hypothetical protein